MRRGAAAILTVAVIMAPATAVHAQEGSPVPAATVVPELADGRDLYLDMPYFIGGFEPEIVMTRGAEHFGGLDPAVAADEQTRAELEALLEAAGGEVDDMVTGYALVSQGDFFSFVVGIRIEGAEPGSLLPAYLPTLLDDLADPSTVPGTVGGKDVVVVSSIGTDDEYVALYVHEAGDTIWILQGPEDVVETTLLSLP